MWTTAQAAVLLVKGCYQDPLFASGIRPLVAVCGLNMMRVYHVPMHTLEKRENLQIFTSGSALAGPNTGVISLLLAERGMQPN